MKSWSQKCQNLHGHSYICEVFLSGKELDENGMIMDFGAIKEALRTIIDTFDHKTVLNEKDCLVSLLDSDEITVVNYNPTAENMALDITKWLAVALQKDNVCKIRVRLHETTTGWAEYEMDENELIKYRQN